jgi:hypothetical protein
LDPRWHVVAGIELFADLGDADSNHRGVVRARPHPAGWFISAHHHPDITADELAHLAEFARVRAYLLSTAGPTVDTWTPSQGQDNWIAYWDVDALDVAVPIPDTVPTQWQ